MSGKRRLKVVAYHYEKTLGNLDQIIMSNKTEGHIRTE